MGRVGFSTGGGSGVVIIVDSCCMDGEGFLDCRFFGAVFIWPFSVLMESGSNFWTESDVRPVRVAKKLLLLDFVQEEIVGLNADRCRNPRVWS